MHTIDIERDRADAAPTELAEPRRFDMYQPIHKALRAYLCTTLLRLGAVDVAEPAELQAALAMTRELLDQMVSHLEHENLFVHPALEAAARGSSHQIAAEHAEHLATIAVLRGEVDCLAQQPSTAHALRLYRHFALFVAENLTHMHFEETVHNASLWAGYTDAELHALEGRLLASIAPPEMQRTLRWMLPAINHGQRVDLIMGMRQVAPPPMVAAVLDLAQTTLDAATWAKLARAVGIPAHPGLVMS